MSEVNELLAEAKHEMTIFDRPSRRTSLRMIEALTTAQAEIEALRARVAALVEALAIFDEPMSPLTAGERGGELACAVRTFLSSTGDSK